MHACGCYGIISLNTLVLGLGQFEPSVLSNTICHSTLLSMCYTYTHHKHTNTPRLHITLSNTNNHTHPHAHTITIVSTSMKHNNYITKTKVVHTYCTTVVHKYSRHAWSGTCHMAVATCTLLHDIKPLQATTYVLPYIHVIIVDTWNNNIKGIHIHKFAYCLQYHPCTLKFTYSVVV